MDTIIRKISVFGLDASHPDGFHVQVGKEAGNGIVHSITMRGDAMYERGERIYTVKVRIPDEDEPDKGGIYIWKEIILGKGHSAIVEHDTRAF